MAALAQLILSFAGNPALIAMIGGWLMGRSANPSPLTDEEVAALEASIVRLQDTVAAEIDRDAHANPNPAAP